MKLIIDIPAIDLNTLKNGSIMSANILNACKSGIPLDDVKAEIEELRCGQPLRKFVVDECLEILDNIGKAEKGGE